VTTGFLGGAFDPPHNGHLALAGEAIDRFRLDPLVVVVTGEPPHKRAVSDAEMRFRLAEAAFEGVPGVEVSRHELDRDGPSYTAETAHWAAERYRDPLFLVGADEFCDFLSWHEPDAILDAARLAVASRPGFPQERLDAVLRGLEHPDRVELFEIEPLPISSRELRERVARNEPIDGFVPPAVARLVAALGLYRSE
jgi:nicotinate-nucleotide adenylyltransferase